MGQYQSVLHNTQVIDIKRQAAATDLLDTAVWYYDPIAGKNIWGNRAALNLFNVSAEGFSQQQQAAWQAARGTAAAETWQASNQRLADGLNSAEDGDSSDAALFIRPIILRGTGQPDVDVHAAFLPLPGDLLQMSAHARPCTIIHKKQQLRVYQIHVADLQRISIKSARTPVAKAGMEVAQLQFQLAEQLNRQPDVVTAGSIVKQPSGESDAFLLNLPDGSAHVLTQALQRQRASSTSPASIGHQSSSRLGKQTSSTWTSPSIPTGRQPSRSLDFSTNQAICTVGPVCLRIGTPGSARTSTGVPSADGAVAAVAATEQQAYKRDNTDSWSLLSPVKQEGQQHRQQRLMGMCDSHAMFQFLFDAEGHLLTANKRALNNMREHLGEQQTYTFAQYLSIGQCDGGLTPEEIFKVIYTAIYINQEPCFRLPQLRWSKRRPGKCRWVLYEIWPMDDPVTGQPALLVTEQNITQVKAVEDQYSNQMRQLETQLEEAILQQQQAEAAAAQATAEAESAKATARNSVIQAAPAFDTSSAAEKTLQLLDKLLNGEFVGIEEAEDLRSAIVDGGSSLHAPVFLDEQVLNHTQAYEPEVGASLLQMLSTRMAWEQTGKDLLPDAGDGDSPRPSGPMGRMSPSLAATDSGLSASSVQQSYPVSQRGDSRLSQTFSPDVAAAALANGIEAASAAAEGTGLPTFTERGRRLSAANVSAYPVVTAESGSRRPSNSSAIVAAGGSNMSAIAGAGSPYGRGAIAAAAREVISLATAPATELEAILAKADDWQFDTFALSTASGGRPLSTLGFHLLHRSGLIKKLSLDEMRLSRWLVRLEDGYKPNPYHNKIHAADVLRSAHVLLTRGGCAGAQGPDDITHLALYLAAIIHDFEHRGVTNDFLVRTGDALALLYNDRSPHENHHLAASWGQLVEYNFLKALPLSSKEIVRRLVIEMVLATDMKQHFAIHGLFQSKVHLLIAAGHLPRGSTGTVTPGTAASGALFAVPAPQLSSSNLTISIRSRTTDSPTSLSAANSRQHLQTAATAAAACGPGGNSSNAAGPSRTSSTGLPANQPVAASNSFAHRMRRTSSAKRRLSGDVPTWEEDAETRSLYLQMCLKTADLGHLAAARPVHRKWVEALEEENFRQGDREKTAGMTVSPLMDRTRAGITKSQVGFFDIVALPLFKSMAQRFPGMTPMLEGVVDNYNMWKETEVPPVAAQ